MSKEESIISAAFSDVEDVEECTHVEPQPIETEPTEPKHQRTQRKKSVQPHHQPVNKISLPSNNKLYDSVVPFRDVEISDEKLLSSTTEDTFIDVLNGVVRSVLGDLPYYDELTLDDRDYAIVKMWVNNFDPIMEFPVYSMIEEGYSETVKVDLRELTVNEINPKFSGSIAYTTTKKGTQVAINLPTVGDETAVRRYLKSSGRPESDFETLVAIRCVDVGVDFATIDAHEKFVSDVCNATDLATIRAILRQMRYGYDLSKTHTMKSGEVVKYDVPFSAAMLVRPVVQIDLDKYL